MRKKEGRGGKKDEEERGMRREGQGGRREEESEKMEKSLKKEK